MTTCHQPIMNALKIQLKRAVDASGVSASRICLMADLNQSAIRDIIRNRSKNPGLVTIAKLATVLGLRVDDLINEGRDVEDAVKRQFQ